MRPLEIQHHLHTLSLPADATEADVRKAFRELASICHPDKHNSNPNLKDRANAQFANFNEARNALLEYFRNGAPEEEELAANNSEQPPGNDGNRGRCHYQSPTAEIENVTVEYNVERNSVSGMLINIHLVQLGFQEQQGVVAAYFQFANGEALTDTNEAFCNASGQVAVIDGIASNLGVFSERKEYTLFLPHDELHLDVECKTDCRFFITAFCQHANGSFEPLANSNYVPFSYGSISAGQTEPIMDTSSFRCPECLCDVVSVHAMHLQASATTPQTKTRLVYNPATKLMMPQLYVSQVLVNPDLHQYTTPPVAPYQKTKNAGCTIVVIMAVSLIFPPIYVLTLPLCIYWYIQDAGGVSDTDYAAALAEYQRQHTEYQKTWVCPRCMKKWLFN